MEERRQTEMKTLIGKEDWKQGIGNEQSEVKNSAKRLNPDEEEVQDI